MSTDLTAMQDRINSMLSQINAESIQVRLYTGPYVPTTDDVPQVSGAGYTRAGGDATWTSCTINVTHPILAVYDPAESIWDDEDYDPVDPYELDMDDATPTGIGDPLADVLRSIDEVLADDRRP